MKFGLKRNRFSHACCLALFVILISGCSDRTSETSSEDGTTDGRATDSGATLVARKPAKPQILQPDNGLSTDSTIGFDKAIALIKSASALPKLDLSSTTGPLHAVLDEHYVEEVEDDSVDRVARLSALLGRLRALDNTVFKYNRAVTSGDPLGTELISLLQQRCRLSAAGGRVAADGEELPSMFLVPSSAAVEWERSTWLFTLSWNQLAQAVAPPVWNNLNEVQRGQLLDLINEAARDLSPVTYEAYRSSILQNWPGPNSSDHELMIRLAKPQGLLNDARFAPHLLGDAREKFDLSSVPVPDLPELGEFHYSVEDETIQVWEFRFDSEDSQQLAGFNTEVRVLMPAGTHPAKSLPCIFRAPAGTDLEAGSDLDLNEDTVYLAETVPYLEAGFCVVEYSLDGEEPETSGFDLAASGLAYLQFRAACAGMVNARNAIEFAIHRIPQVNPNALFASGHSSAGTAALLAAAHDLPLHGAIAFAPATDVAKANYSRTANDASFKPGVHSFRVKSSPITQLASIHIPIFIFHAVQDDVVKFEQSQSFASALKQQGGNVTLVSGEGHDHYATMIEEGIPAAIAWVRKQLNN